MSKYIIDLNDECNMVQQICIAENCNVYIKAEYAENLEELNPDYINEHYGDLQDEAYQRGLEDGKQTVVGAAELREKLEYQKGFKDGKAQVERGCDGCKYEWVEKDEEPCAHCANCYINHWTAKDDKIEVGDEVERYVDGKFDSKGIYLNDADEKGDYWNCLFWTGACFVTLGYPKNQFKKTGRHFNIASILEEMKE